MCREASEIQQEKEEDCVSEGKRGGSLTSRLWSMLPFVNCWASKNSRKDLGHYFRESRMKTF